jgi:hypothetical protein
VAHGLHNKLGGTMRYGLHNNYVRGYTYLPTSKSTLAGHTAQNSRTFVDLAGDPGSHTPTVLLMHAKNGEKRCAVARCIYTLPYPPCNILGENRSEMSND